MKDKHKVSAYNKAYYSKRKLEPDYLRKKRDQVKAHYHSDPSKMKAYQKWYRETHPEKCKARSAAYYASHKEKFAIYSKTKHMANPSVAIERFKRWAKKNPERASASRRHIKSVRRAREKSTPLESSRIRSFTERHIKKKSHRCYYCNRRFSGQFHIDHIQSLFRGGKHQLENLCISCPTCNLKKNSKPLTDLTMLKQPVLNL